MIRTHWDPFQDLQDETALTAQLNRMLAYSLGAHSWAAALDISERKDAYVVALELHGVEAGDFQIVLEDGLLAVQGERQLAYAS